MEKIIEIYGKELKNDKGSKFIAASWKRGNGENVEYVNVRFTQDANVKTVKGYQKVKFDTKDSNVKTIKRKDGKDQKILYIKKAEIVPYTDKEREAMNERQEQAVIDLFN